MIRTCILILAALLASIGCSARASDVEREGSVVTLSHDGERWVMLRNGEPYFVRGAGGRGNLEQLVAAGGNSIRTWGADRAGEVLDRAHELGLTVTLGIWIQHPRHGFDYSDEAAVAEQRELVRRVVQQHKDHPALLMWGVGNEVEIASDPDLVFPEINTIAGIIRSIDPDHPTMAVLAGPWNGKIERYVEHCPDVDLVGINSYGGVGRVPEELTMQGYKGAYLITEFGPLGHWEIGKAEWGAPIEPPSSEKARMYREAYERAIASEPTRCLGSYVFLWGHKQETTSTWYGMFLPTGESTEAVDVMHRLWSGEEPAQRAPTIGRIESPVALKKTDPDTETWATVEATDPDGDELEYEWIVTAETTDRRMGGDREAVPPSFPELTISHGPRAVFKTPGESGAYRLFVTVRDGTGRAATANVPFYVR